MAEQGWDRAEFRCGHCGTRIEATDQAQFARMLQEHRGPACLALLSRLSGRQLVQLAIDIQHVVEDTQMPVEFLVQALGSWGEQVKQREARDAAQKAPDNTPQA